MNKDILAALTSVSARLTDVETRISKTEDKLQQKSPNSASPHCHHTQPTSSEELPDIHTTPRRRRQDSSSEDDTLIPSITALKSNKGLQRQVDNRVQELGLLSEKGKYKSQRGGVDTVYVAK